MRRMKTHLQLNVGKLGNFNALRVATEDYLRSRRIFRRLQLEHTHDEDSMEVDAVSRKGKGKEQSARARRVARKEKKATQAKVTILDVLDMSAHHGLHLNFQW